MALPRAFSIVALSLALLGAGGGARAQLQEPQPAFLADKDFQPEDAVRAAFEAEDFHLTFEGITARSDFGTLRGETVSDAPALGTLAGAGGAQALITLGPCTLNEPHAHLRATEFGFVTQGEILMGFVEENFNNKTRSGGRVVQAAVRQGSSFVFPQGLIHFQMNRGCTPAQFLATFTARDPGLATTALGLFHRDMPLDVLRANTGLTTRQIQFLQAKLETVRNPTPDPECQERCKAASNQAPAPAPVPTALH